MASFGTPHNRASELALEIYANVLEEVRADRLVQRAVERAGDYLFVHGNHIDLSSFDRVWIAGAGKASVTMAHALGDILGPKLAGGLVITKSGYGFPLPGIEVIESSHPIPDETSLLAGERMIQFGESLTEKDLVIFTLSGGASALMESLVPSVSLEDLRATTQALMANSSSISQLNYVRSKLSRIKGGKLSQVFFPATVIVLVLSDVIGNDLRIVGSGPFFTPSRTVLRSRFTSPIVFPQGLFSKPVSDLRENQSLNLGSAFPDVQHYVVGSISVAIHAATDAARAVGLGPLPYADPMLGEARTMAGKICRHASQRNLYHQCMIFGGETTVTLHGNGIGGRSQEMAVAAASAISKLPNTCFLAAGTDGSDGPTDAAGGIVDPDSMNRARSAGFRVPKTLKENDSYHFLEACDGLIKTGPTGSNVNDLVLVVQAEN